MSRKYADPVERLLLKIDVRPGFWLWKGAKQSRGYGVLSINGHMRLARRAVYELFKGSIPEGLQLHHLCGITLCVRPSHLIAVSAREHALELTPTCVTYIASRVTMCPQGHPYSQDNVYHLSRNERRCKVCSRAQVSMRYWKRKEKMTKKES